MAFDISCVKCLNLFDSLEERKSFLNSTSLQKLAKNNVNANLNYNNKTSVFSILNQCCTKFGARTLRTWLMQPLQDKQKIDARLSIVEAFVSQVNFNVEMRNTYLSKIDDIQTRVWAVSALERGNSLRRQTSLGNRPRCIYRLARRCRPGDHSF